MLLRRIAIAGHRVLKEPAVFLHMAVKVHHYQAVELQEARIDVAHKAGIRKRYFGDNVVSEPFDPTSLCEPVDHGGIDPCVDRATQQSHGMRNC